MGLEVSETLDLATETQSIWYTVPASGKFSVEVVLTSMAGSPNMAINVLVTNSKKGEEPAAADAVSKATIATITSTTDTTVVADNLESAVQRYCVYFVDSGSLSAGSALIKIRTLA